MSQVGWFPRYNPDGSRLTWERPNYWRAQFFTDTVEMADNGVNLVIGGQPISALTCSELGAGGGVWAACRTDPVRVYTSTGLTIPGAGCPAVNPNGQIAYVDDRQGDVKNLLFDGRRVARGGITDVRGSRTALVWLDNGRTWGLRLDQQGATAQPIQVAPWEAGPVPIDTPLGPWVGCFTQTGLIVRPFGDTLGYRFDNGGQTYFPDWVFRDGVIVAIFTNDQGEQSTQTFDPQTPRVPLGVASAPEPPAVPPTVPVPPTPPQPMPVPIPVPPEEPMPKTKDQVRADITELIRFYNEPDGLNRAARGRPSPVTFDDPAITDWFTLAVMQDVEDIKRQIRTFGEWKAQHQSDPQNPQ